MINYIKKMFNQNSKDKSKLLAEIGRIYAQVPQDFGGGCSIEKALAMSLLIKEFNLQNTVDIGVYRGRSLFPQAIAHKLFSNGIVYGIDPYTKEAANQSDYPEIQKELDEFVSTTDFQKLFDDVSLIINENYKENCILIRKKSSDAVADFKQDSKQLDMVHIDGNHDTKFVMDDVENYLPLLSEKSFIVLDDISWKSVEPAIILLNKEMNFVTQKVDKQNDFAIFSKGLSKDEVIGLKNKIDTEIS
tara:strand:- start:83421 stop:84158 length:738 start_codon:yes stop_codon:yes gene_type:complete